MSKFIQHTSQYDPISIGICLQRKGLKKDQTGLLSLNNYTLNITTTGLKPNPNLSTAPSFTNSYFVPVFNATNVNYTTVQFQAFLHGVQLKNYPIQMKWDFDDGSEIFYDTKEQLESKKTVLEGNCSIAANSWNDTYKTTTYTTSLAHSLSVGSSVTITGMKPYNYNGTYIVKGVTSTTFTVDRVEKDFGITTSSGTYTSVIYQPVYHKFKYGGRTVESNYVADQVPVTLSVIDNLGRKSITSIMVYPKVDA